MKEFLEKHQAKVLGSLSCFDRIIMRGYLPIQNARSMCGFLKFNGVELVSIKEFLLNNADRLKRHARELAEKWKRPYLYLERGGNLEQKARAIAEEDGIEQGLVCVFGLVQPCWTFSFPSRKATTYIRRARRQCIFLYFYFMDRDFGLIHVSIQTWFPMTIQVYLNGHEWLARKLDSCGIGYTRVDNAFVRIDDLARAQALSDRLASFGWVAFLERYARKINPLMRGLLKEVSYYWATAQSEYATDVIFADRRWLQELYPRLLSHSIRCFGAKEVMSFLGRKLNGHFLGEVVGNLSHLAHLRIPGARVKHRMKQNWIKMYDKAGLVLRIETVINNPGEFRVRRKVRRNGIPKTEWVPMRKGVAFMFRYRDVSSSANARYLGALAAVDDPTTQVLEIDRVTRRRSVGHHRTARALNPLSRDDVALFQAVMSGEHALRGLTNANMRARLRGSVHLRGLEKDPRRASSKVTRIFQRLHAHGLIAKIPRSRRWRTTRLGYRIMSTAITMRTESFPALLAKAA
jgi:hypothetical protein